MDNQAIALCRVSTAKQRLEGSSLEAQEERIYEAASTIGATIVKVWSLNISSRKGKNYKRKDLEEMLIYAKHNKAVKYFIVDEPDRFMRDFDKYFFWKVRFQEEADTRLVYAKKPHLVFEDSSIALMEEMIDVFRAESSNTERITKTTSNMKMRVKMGYYPGRAKAGYKKSETPGLHVPSGLAWTMIRDALQELASGVSLKDVVASLNDRGYRTVSGNKLDLFNFKKIAVDPYYAGIIKMGDWEINPQGLHKSMITIDQHELILSIVLGIKYKKRKGFNPDFCLSNQIECTECAQEGAKYPRLVGYVHNNGKLGDKRKFYSRYRCRSCGANILRDELHTRINNEILNIKLSEAKRDDFYTALRQVWRQDESMSISRVNTLRNRLEHLQNEKNKLVRQSVYSRISDDDIQAALQEMKTEILALEVDISSAEDIEKDFIEFVEFTMTMIDNMQEEFWQLDEEHMGWCKQLLYPEGFSVSRDKKVYTPVISEFYRLVSSKKDPAGSDEINMVGDRGVEPLTSTTSMWRSSQLS
jgi:site-specific DNA recombinase